MQLEIKQLQDENAHLREHVEQLKSDPDAIEHEAREKLHYAKPNEVIVALAGAGAKPATSEVRWNRMVRAFPVLRIETWGTQG